MPTSGIAARYESRASSSPPITSSSRPQRSATAARKSALLAAARSPAVPTATTASAPCSQASSAIAAIASIVRAVGSGGEPTRVREPLAEPGHLRAIDELPPRPVARALGEEELHRVRPDVDDRVRGARRARAARFEPARQADVGQRAQAELLAASRARGRDPPTRPRSCAVAAIHVRVGQLGHAPADRVVPPRLVHGYRDGGRGCGRTTSSTSSSSVYAVARERDARRSSAASAVSSFVRRRPGTAPSRSGSTAASPSSVTWSRRLTSSCPSRTLTGASLPRRAGTSRRSPSTGSA